MLGVKKLCALAVSICLLWFLAVPAFAADPQVTSKDLKGISPKHYKYAFSVIGGAAVGAGIGALVNGWSNDVAKGLLIGAGGASALLSPLSSARHPERLAELGLHRILHSLRRRRRLDRLRLQSRTCRGNVDRRRRNRHLAS